MVKSQATQKEQVTVAGVDPNTPESVTSARLAAIAKWEHSRVCGLLKSAASNSRRSGRVEDAETLTNTLAELEAHRISFVQAENVMYTLAGNPWGPAIPVIGIILGTLCTLMILAAFFLVNKVMHEPTKQHPRVEVVAPATTTAPAGTTTEPAPATTTP